MRRIIEFGHVIGLVFIVFTPVFTQPDLMQQLEGKNKLGEIMPVVDAYYANHPKDEEVFESRYLHWKRWEWYMANRLGPKGEFVNISEMLMRGTNDMKRMEMVDDERNINSQWSFMGPSSSPLLNEDALFNGVGRVDRITFHPTQERILFIGTPAGGLWSTLDTGNTWQNLTDYIPSTGISGFVISYANTSDMYILTGDGDTYGHPLGYARQSVGVLKSTDGGVSWNQTGEFPNTFGPYVGYALVQSPADPELLMAATSTGLYRTTNGGETWIKEFSGQFYDIKFKPGDPTRVYAVKNGEFLLSINSGDTWTGNATFDFDPDQCQPEAGRWILAVTPVNPNYVYLLTGPVTDIGTFCGFYRSTNSGSSFTRRSFSPNIFGAHEAGLDSTDQSYYDIALVCHPDNADIVFAAGCTIWKTTNGGSTWQHTTSFNENGAFPYVHPDIHYLAYNPLNDFLYVANDGGVWESDNHGVSWENLSNNIETSMFYHLAGWNGNNNKLMGGLQDNGVKYRKDNSSVFHHITCCDGFDVVFNPITGEPAYSSVNWSLEKYSSNGEYSDTFTPQGFYQWFQRVTMHNADTNIVLVGSFQMFKSTNSAEEFTEKGGSGSWALTSCPSNSSRFYSAGGYEYDDGAGSFYFSGDVGETWIAKDENPGFPHDSLWNRISDIGVRPNNSSTVYVCFSGFTEGIKVIKSTNTGDTWTNISANLPNVPVNALAIDNDDGVYAGTDIGVFYRSATMSNWMPWSNALPNVPVTDLVIFDNGTIRKLRAATFGRGIWQSDLAASCDASVIVTGGIKGINHYEASTSITSSAFIQGGIGTFVSFQSGSYITLSDGFNVVDDSEFLGFISPCGQGGIPSIHDMPSELTSHPNASIIPLRRMWDTDDELPFGSIDQIQVNTVDASVKFSIKKPGKVQMQVARQIQDKLITAYNDEQQGGTQSVSIDLASMEKDFYYLLLFYEGKLADFQEFDLRH
jgi:photosystem II stability/assembly factor-like uncharacterized protein